MTDVPTGGRIVPVVEAHQHYSIRPADEAVAEQRPPTQQLPAHPPQPHQEDDSDGRSSQKLPPQSQVKSSKNTRSKNAETECLELPCLSKLGLYALPTEGDGNSSLPLDFQGISYILLPSQWGSYTVEFLTSLTVPSRQLLILRPLGPILWRFHPCRRNSCPSRRSHRCQ